MLYSFINFSNNRKYPDHFKNIPFVGYFNHNKYNINYNNFLIKDIQKFKYTPTIFNSNPYLGYINHAKLFEFKLNNVNCNKEKPIQCDFDFLINTLVQKYKLCEDIKTKKTNEIGIQCNITNEEDFEIIDNDELGIPKSSFEKVADYIYKKSLR